MTYIILFLFTFLNIIYANDCRGKSNIQDPIPAEPYFVKRVAHGALYNLKDGDDVIDILALKGNAYEMGKAYGELVAQKLNFSVSIVLPSYQKRIFNALKIVLPLGLVKFLVNSLVPLINFGLDLTWLFTKDYTPQRYFDEIRGIADGSKLPYMKLLTLSLFPELIKASCSLVGVWGNASIDHNIHFLRGFDWDVDAPMTKFPTIVVYHSTEPGSIPFANFGYGGMIGAITALNARGLAIAMKHWPSTIPDDARSDLVGKPWTYTLRDVAQFEHNLAGAIKNLNDTKRTCTIHVGVASAEDNSYRGMRYSASRLSVYDDKHYPQTDEKHPLVDGCNYVDRWHQPTRDDCFGSLLKENHGKIDSKFLYQELGPKDQTGDCQLFIFDLKKEVFYFSLFTFSPETPGYEKQMFMMTHDQIFNKLTV